MYAGTGLGKEGCPQIPVATVELVELVIISKLQLVLAPLTKTTALPVLPKPRSIFPRFTSPVFFPTGDHDD